MNKTLTTDRPELSASQQAQLRAAETIEPDTKDIPPAPAANWRYARRLGSPRKEAISIRIDADILAWLRETHPRYQSEINNILRERMAIELARRNSAATSDR